MDEIFSTKNTYQNPEKADLEASPYRLAIMQKDGYMGELWLPEIVEGRYSFEVDCEDENYPVSIKAVNERWFAVCEEGAFFTIQDCTVKQAAIEDRALLEMHYRGSSYYIYAEAEHRNDNIFLPYYVERTDEIKIGRQKDCDVCYESLLVSRHHAVISWKNDSWVIKDCGSTNGVYVNGLAINEKRLRVGDSIYIMGLRIIMGTGYIALNNGNQRVRITTPLLRRIVSNQGVWFAECPPSKINEYINRMPRKRVLLKPEPIEIEAPPGMMSNKMPLILRVGSPLLMGGHAIMSGNIFSAVTSMMMPMLTQGYTEKDRKEYEQKRLTKYREYLTRKKECIEAEKEEEKTILNSLYPDIASVLGFIENRERLWERQRRDEDFLNIRIGHGDIPIQAEIRYPPKRFGLEQDVLEEEMYDLAEKKIFVPNAPVMLSLKEHFVCGVTGTSNAVVDFLRNVIVQTAMTHSYDEVKMVLLSDGTCPDKLNFVRYLPHFWDNNRTIRYVAESKSDAQQLSKELTRLYEYYTESTPKHHIIMKTEPVYVIFVLSKEMFDAVAVLKSIAASAEYQCFSIVAAYDNMPKECSALVSMSGVPCCNIIDLRNPKQADLCFKLDPFPETYGHDQIHELMTAKLRMDEQQFALPSMITFLDMFGVGKVEYLNPMKRWRENNPVKSLAAEIGVGTDGKLFTLDLHEKKQGPHGLIAGSTGSGKSEFIITYILSMAVNYSPDEVAFVLIDYKGGGLADAFVDKKRGIHLPHVVGVMTNLDGAGVQRSFISINSELKRRQALFASAKSETGEGTMDIYDYQRLYRQKRVHEPLPHLFIVSDEFAELKKEQPEFMDGLISTARIGRSLGVHLILATQKPSGVVNDQIWSNTKFRVCLKVADKSDSMEVLKRPDAAELKNTGRFYLQVGYNELFALGQSAWCGAPYDEQEEHEDETEFAVQFLDTTGQVMLTKKQEKAQKTAAQKQVVAIVQYLSDLAKRENIIPKQLWKDNLPEKIDFEAIRQTAAVPAKGINALIGMVDDPEHQNQFPLWQNLMSFHHMSLIGPSGSGKSTFFRSILWSLSERYTPEEVNYYIVDLSGGSLGAFRHMPHCGAYLTQENEQDYDRLIEMLREMANERKRIFRKEEVSGFDSYVQIGKMPLILVIIDSYQNIFAEFSKGPEIAANMHSLLAELASCGIHFLLSVNNSNEISTKAKQEIDCAFALMPKDRYTAGEIVSVKVPAIPQSLPGRGICVTRGRALEFHTAMFGADLSEQTALKELKSRLEKMADDYPADIRAKRLPVMSSGQTYEEFASEFEIGRVPLGYSAKDMKPIALPLQQFVNLPFYIGNPDGSCPVLRNILHAAYVNHMRVIVVKRKEDSAFDSLNNILDGYAGKAKVVYCNDTAITALAQELNKTVSERNSLVNEYSDIMGIPREESGRAKKAAAYVREHSEAILVLFESFGDFALLNKSDMAQAVFNSFIGGLKGYNIYFAGLLYAKDYNLRGNRLLTGFTQTETMVLLGGAYANQCLSSSLPAEYRRIDKSRPDYDRGLLGYRGEWYDIQMPCGELEHPAVAEGEEAII